MIVNVQSLQIKTGERKWTRSKSQCHSLGSRRLGIVRKKNWRSRMRHARGEGACLLRARLFSLSPTTSKRLKERKRERGQTLVFGSLVGCLHCYKCCHCKIWKKFFRDPQYFFFWPPAIKPFFSWPLQNPPAITAEERIRRKVISGLYKNWT